MNDANQSAPRGLAGDALLISFACLALSIYADDGKSVTPVALWAAAAGAWFMVFLLRVGRT